MGDRWFHSLRRIFASGCTARSANMGGMRASHKLALGLLLCGAAACEAQTLARKNWAGSGIRVEPWYESAVFYQIDPLTFQDSNGDGFGDLAGITTRLPYLEQLGVDAIVLSPMPLEPPGSSKPLDPVYGSTEDFDLLEREATAHHMRVLVDLAGDMPHEQMLATARFWLSRGVAGLRLVDASAQQLRELRAIAGTTRILIGEKKAEPAVASRHPAPRVQPDLVFDRRLMSPQMLTPTLLRGVLGGSNLLTDQANLKRSLGRLGDGAHDLAIARIAATALLLGRGCATALLRTRAWHERRAGPNADAMGRGERIQHCDAVDSNRPQCHDQQRDARGYRSGFVAELVSKAFAVAPYGGRGAGPGRWSCSTHRT